VGAINGGWAVAVTTLMGEREAVGDSKDAPAGVVVELLTRLWRELSSRGEPVSPALRDEVAGLAALSAVAEWTNQRLVEDAVRRGGAGPEMSMAKLLRNRLVQRTISTAGSLLGPRAVADTGEWGTYAWARAALNAPGMRLGGGTDEIQLNILAERVLQLPR
jgi:acyl-CoA dehydrogenase